MRSNQQSATAPVEPDPTGAISLFEAMEKQLGLKLQMEKRPVEALVIDHIELLNGWFCGGSIRAGVGWPR